MTAQPDPQNSKKRILDDHREIGELLAQCTTATKASQVLENMQKLRALLGRHFAEEEGQLGGLHDSIHTRAPRFENSLQGLIEEHRQLLESVNELIDQAGKSADDDPKLREMSKSLQARFAAHEARETEIFVESLWTDIGGAAD